jgi:hypothetical protein
VFLFRPSFLFEPCCPNVFIIILLIPNCIQFIIALHMS